MVDLNRPWKDGPVPSTADMLETARVCTDDGYPTIGKLAEEILRLRTFIRSTYIVASTTGDPTMEDARGFIQGTIETCEFEIRSWGEDPNAPVQAIEAERDRTAQQKLEDTERAELARLREKYPDL